MRSPLVVIFITVFIDLVGFGLIIPTAPFIARNFGASAAEVGLLMAIFSFMQFLFSPFWGALSDRIGRRPTVLITLLGSALSYFIFAFSNSLWLLFVSRALAGLFGGNISTAHAYIGDVTPPQERSKGMGLIGAAFGLGFVFGPLLGAGLGIIGQKLGNHPPFGLSFSALVVGFLCLANCAFAWLRLKESLPPEVRARAREANPRQGRLKTAWGQIRRPVTGSLMVVYFLSGLAMAQMESMLIPYMADRFHWGLEITMYGFAYIGVVMMITQGFLVRYCMPKFGEPVVLCVGLVMFALSLFGLAAAGEVWGIGVAMTFLALGNGLMRPPNLGIISLLTPPEEQGRSMGVTNSLASLGRILGPLLGGYLYESVSGRAPFIGAGVVALLALAMTVANYGQLPSSGKTTSEVT